MWGVCDFNVTAEALLTTEMFILAPRLSTLDACHLLHRRVWDCVKLSDDSVTPKPAELLYCCAPGSMLKTGLGRGGRGGQHTRQQQQQQQHVAIPSGVPSEGFWDEFFSDENFQGVS